MGEPLERWAIIEDVPPRSTVAWWIVAWLPKGMRHIYVVELVGPNDQGQVWAVLNPAACGFDFALLLTDGHLAFHAVTQGKTAVRLPVLRNYRLPYFRGWMTCTAVVKYLSGLRWPMVWTPGQLIRRCEREGFEVRRPCE